MALTLNKDHVILIEGTLSGKYNGYKHTFIKSKNISREHQHMKGRIVWKTVTTGKVHCNIFSYRWIYSVGHQQKHIKPEQAWGLRTPYCPALITLACQGIFQPHRSQQTGEDWNHNKNRLTGAKLLIKITQWYFCWYYVLFFFAPSSTQEIKWGRKISYEFLAAWAA